MQRRQRPEAALWPHRLLAVFNTRWAINLIVLPVVVVVGQLRLDHEDNEAEEENDEDDDVAPTPKRQVIVQTDRRRMRLEA